ncbi:MAG: hypothetical protein KKE62_18015 [Proteobacteria bacterium]|nr:hypothetical protein [Pseudomonadota bacterium]MBU1386788.1 hypothetical protein [Pseudomonadota bacterium]MBU1544732.1 hypothetical protein [Pseudomonadota bacterium]MBU2429929.1 hypothetical protein [Pseudomonadota bacterium]MBU2481359.1 hypothetical protein [Pseudomonadota bacterium]
MDNTFSREQIEDKKKAIFDAMGTRGQKQILKKGYEKWDPFQEPKDPIDIRKDKTKRTSQMLIREFLSNIDADEYSNTYAQAALEMCLGIINDEERTRGMFDFAIWYADLLKKEGYDTL